ncbi:hypothetical protein F4779DRAFT_327970 [Xylariaceae sp. FL0662B]|nr:hypothetical protein F4779DRAFT_327970 [Xylariaceae sp. FL0662B]
MGRVLRSSTGASVILPGINKFTALQVHGVMSVYISYIDDSSSRRGITDIPITDDDVETAYPGTACIDGWNIGCTTTLSLRNQSITQTWCCPESYSCPNSDWERLFTGRITPTRVCTSQITVSDILYLRENKTTYLPYVLSASALSLQPNLSSLRALHPVFPLVGESKLAASNSTSIPAKSTNTGTIAGATVGSVVGFLLLVVGAVVFRRRALGRRRDDKGDETTAVNLGDEKSGADHGFDGKAELPPNPLAELPGYVDPAELHGTSIVEISTSDPVGELPGSDRVAKKMEE